MAKKPSSPSIQLHLFMSIVVLTLMLRYFQIVPPLFDTALFSCLSMPVVYVMSYYHAKEYSRAGKFVIRKESDVKLWGYEVMSLVVGFIMGYLVFVALTGSSDYVVYGVAFCTVQFMRMVTAGIVAHLSNLGIDTQRPIAVMGISMLVATITFLCLAVFFVLL